MNDLVLRVGGIYLTRTNRLVLITGESIVPGHYENMERDGIREYTDSQYRHYDKTGMLTRGFERFPKDKRDNIVKEFTREDEKHLSIPISRRHRVAALGYRNVKDYVEDEYSFILSFVIFEQNLREEIERALRDD